ncbi:glycosyltransferase family 4 protein [Paenibacillus sp. OV219]|uniref:glycosyltransferase family 4 protein n=1 Tax=Paenibacillus sp. OV219 TaxID=1884377 RepID=UPI0008BA4B39|nr:glycosyltransferase family 4 protein [Paenibacillus sp. OV219]SEM53840.1 spore coat protein SA [Paenibacillus sp. OV219]
MRLLIIAPEQIPVPPFKGGSVQNCIYQISKHASDKYQITIVSRWSKNLSRISTIGNVTIYRVSGATKKVYLQNAIQKVKNKKFDYIQIDNRPSFVPQVRTAFQNIPISVFMHSMTFVSLPMTTRQKARNDLRGANLIIGNSNSLKQALTSRFPTYSNKIKYVHLGVDISKFRPRKTKKTGKFHFLFAGRLIPRKGIPILLKAFKIALKSNSSLQLSIAGGALKSTYKTYLQKTARQLKIPVTFTGNLSRERMPAFYRSGDCFICPSQKHEAFGLVNVEAMACGLPVIASNNGGVPEIVEHQGNGFLVKNYRRPSSFASDMIRLANDPDLCNRLSVQARKDAVDQFSWKRTSRKLMKIYEKELV